jgi:integrase
VSVFRRDGRWVAKFQFKGEQIWVPGGPWDTKSSAREAERRERDRLAARRTNETCASFAERWLEEWPRPAESTRRHYAYAVRRFAEEFGPTRLDDVERLSARSWSLGVSRHISRVVGIMYEDARNVGLVENNPFSDLRLPVAERSRDIVSPTLEEYRMLLDGCTVLGGYGAEFRAMIQFSAWTGLRAGELHALRWEDVGAETVRIRGSRKRDGTIGKPKNGKEREIAYLPPARMLDQVARRPDEFVFHTQRGVPLVQGSHHYAWRAVRAASGVPAERARASIPNVRWHDLRHFCATQLLEMGVDHFAVSVQLGHEDGGALVMSRYGHPSKHAARTRMMNAFGHPNGQQWEFTDGQHRVLQDSAT